MVDAPPMMLIDTLQIVAEKTVRHKTVLLVDMNQKEDLVQKIATIQIQYQQELKTTDIAQELVERQLLLTGDLIEATLKIEAIQVTKELRKEAKTKLQQLKVDQILKTVYHQEEKVHREIIRKTDQVQHHKLLHKDKNQVLGVILVEDLKQEEIAIKEEVLNDQKIEDLRFD
jgi:hypothetical protein